MSVVSFIDAQSQSNNVDSVRIHAKRILDGEITPIDDNLTISCLDSLLSTNPSTREYYSVVFSVIISKSDGALSEIIGQYCINYLDMFPKEFITHYQVQSANNKELYANVIAFEFYAEAADFNQAYLSLKKFICAIKSREEMDKKDIANIGIIEDAVMVNLQSYND